MRLESLRRFRRCSIFTARFGFGNPSKDVHSHYLGVCTLRAVGVGMYLSQMRFTQFQRPSLSSAITNAGIRTSRIGKTSCECKIIGAEGVRVFESIDVTSGEISTRRLSVCTVPLLNQVICRLPKTSSLMHRRSAQIGPRAGTAVQSGTNKAQDGHVRCEA